MPEPASVTLLVPPAALRPLLRHAAFGGARGAARPLSCAWYDTPQLDLHRDDIVLCIVRERARARRLIRAGGRWVADTALAPGADELDLAALPDEKWAARARRAAEGGLQPAFEVAGRVRNWRLPPPEGPVHAQLARGELVCGKRREPVCELVLTADEAGQAAQLDLARRLVRDLSLRLAPFGVEGRGYGLAAGMGPLPVKAGPSPLDEGCDARAGLQRIVAQCVAHFAANAEGFGSGGDPEYVHQMRVALRRLRSALRAFSPLLGEALPEHLAAGLRALGNALGPARDWDVLITELLQPVVQAHADDDRIARLAAEAARRRDQARRAAAETLATGAQDRLFIELMAWIACDWQPPPATPSLPAFSAARLEVLHRRVAKAAKRARTSDIASLHRLRIAIKRMRYATEFFAPLYARKAVQAYLKRMADLQQDLGMVNDLANAGPALAACARERPDTAEGVAFVQGWYAPKLAASLARMPSEIEALHRQQRFWRRDDRKGEHG